MSKFNKKYLIFAIILTIVCAIIVTVLYINYKSYKPQESETNTSTQADNKYITDEYYYCYNIKDKEVINDDYSYKYSKYYRFYLVDNNGVNQIVHDKYYTIYNLSEDAINNFDITKFINEYQKYTFDEETLTYTVTQNLILEYDHDDEFDIEKQLAYLNTLGFTNCEIKK